MSGENNYDNGSESCRCYVCDICAGAHPNPNVISALCPLQIFGGFER